MSGQIVLHVRLILWQLLVAADLHQFDLRIELALFILPLVGIIRLRFDATQLDYSLVGIGWQSPSTTVIELVTID